MTTAQLNDASALLCALSAGGIQCTNPEGLRTRLESATYRGAALLDVARRGRKEGIRLHTKRRIGIVRWFWFRKAMRVLTNAGLTPEQSRGVLKNAVPSAGFAG